MHACLGGITDGVNAELIHADSGILLGIRVSWSWLSSVPAECFQSPVVELSYIITKQFHKTLNFTSHNNSVEFFDLVCNQMYTPTVRATFRNIPLHDNGNACFLKVHSKIGL